MILRRLLAAGATAEAALWLLVAWLLLDVLPGRMYRKMLPPATVPGGKAQMPHGEVPLETKRLLRRVVRAIYRVSVRAPFRSVCFHRAIAASYMLRRRGLVAEMHYGVHTSGSHPLRAHVWVTHCGLDVVGGADRDGFVEIARFSGTP